MKLLLLVLLLPLDLLLLEKEVLVLAGPLSLYFLVLLLGRLWTSCVQAFQFL